MPFVRHRLPPPPERTFAQLFPWRNVGRALMLVLLIFAILAIKRSTAPLLGRVTELWGPPPGSPQHGGPQAARSSEQDKGQQSNGVRRIRLGPGLAPHPSSPPSSTPSPPASSAAPLLPANRQ